MRSGLAAANQNQVDIEFDRMTSKPMTMEGTTSKVLGMFLAVLVGAGATWYLELYSLFFPAMFLGLGLGLWASFSKKVRPGLYMAYALVQGVFIGGISGLLESFYPWNCPDRGYRNFCNCRHDVCGLSFWLDKG